MGPAQPDGKRPIGRDRAPSTKHEIREAMQDHRLQLIRRRLERIAQLEAWAMDHFADGADIQVDNIHPVACECSSRRENALFRYCRYFSSFPYTRLVGRQMRFLIRDAGQPTRPLMAIVALSSPVIQIRCRDQWIGWYGPRFNAIRSRRLRSIMDLSVAIAIPPYGDLLAGKLACYVVVSNEVRARFREKYSNRGHDQLALITASSIFGKHSSQYNRVRIGRHTVFRSVGETEGFGTVHIAPDTFEALRELLHANGKPLGYELQDGFNWKLRVIRDALRLLGIDPDVAMRHGIKRGIFVAPLGEKAPEYLREEQPRLRGFDWPLDGLIDHWRTRWLRMRTTNTEVMQRVRSCQRDSLRLTAAASSCGTQPTRRHS